MSRRGPPWLTAAAAALMVASAAGADTAVPSRRTTTCPICQDQASALNLAIGRRERDAASSTDAAALDTEVARLSKQLDACEAAECPASIASPDVTQAAPEPDAPHTPWTDSIGVELAVSLHDGFSSGGYGARAGVLIYGVYLGAELAAFPSANYCFMGPCSQPLRLIGGVAGFDIELARIVIVRPHVNLGSATFFADYDCAGTPNCTSVPRSLYYGGGLDVLFAPPLPLPKPLRYFVGFDISVLAAPFNGEELDKGGYPEVPLSAASYTFVSYVLSLELGMRI